MLSKHRRAEPEALQDVRLCPKLWAKERISEDASQQPSWDWTSWKNSGYADGVYQNKLEEQLADLEEESEEPELPLEGGPDVEIVAQKDHEGTRIEGVVSSEEETNSFLFSLEKKGQLSSPQDYEGARHAWERASLEHKAGNALRTAVKMEKEHAYGFQKSSDAARVALEEGQKWQSMVDKVEPQPMPTPKKCPLPPPKTLQAAEEAFDEYSSWKKDKWSSGKSRPWWKKDDWKWQQGTSSSSKGPEQSIMKQYDAWEEKVDVQAQKYWGTDAWQRDLPQDQQPVSKKSKGKKRKLWLAAQIEALKSEGRWVGGAPSESSKHLRLIREAEMKEQAAKKQRHAASSQESAAEGMQDQGGDTAEPEVPEHEQGFNPWEDPFENFNQMIYKADTIEHVVTLDVAHVNALDHTYKKLKRLQDEDLENDPEDQLE
ncbi:unnamed protein product [Symbiodinium sp. CCMP2592]|nr:unnamed protein product [Symbiodinium sp. CCMP2592]